VRRDGHAARAAAVGSTAMREIETPWK
jgi:hypothetical protein